MMRLCNIAYYTLQFMINVLAIMENQALLAARAFECARNGLDYLKQRFVQPYLLVSNQNESKLRPDEITTVKRFKYIFSFIYIFMSKIVLLVILADWADEEEEDQAEAEQEQQVEQEKSINQPKEQPEIKQKIGENYRIESITDFDNVLLPLVYIFHYYDLNRVDVPHEKLVEFDDVILKTFQRIAGISKKGYLTTNCSKEMFEIVIRFMLPRTANFLFDQKRFALVFAKEEFEQKTDSCLAWKDMTYKALDRIIRRTKNTKVLNVGLYPEKKHPLLISVAESKGKYHTAKEDFDAISKHIDLIVPVLATLNKGLGKLN